MALPDLNSFCFPITTASPLCVTFPGGAQFCAQTPNPPTPLNLSISMLAQISVALAPLQPVFLIIDVIVAIVDCVKAVEGCLGPPPNPTKLIACFPKLAASIAALLQLLPPLSVPLLIVGILETVLAFLKGLRAELVATGDARDRHEARRRRDDPPHRRHLRARRGARGRRGLAHVGRGLVGRPGGIGVD